MSGCSAGGDDAVLPRFWDDHVGDLSPPFHRRRRWVAGAPLQKMEKYFWGNYHVEFGHFVNFSCIYFWAKSLAPSKVDPSLLTRVLPFPSIPQNAVLRSRTPWVWGSAEFPMGSRAEPQPKWNFVNFSLKIWHLVAAVLTALLRINWPNLVLEMLEIIVRWLVSGRWEREFPVRCGRLGTSGVRIISLYGDV